MIFQLSLFETRSEPSEHSVVTSLHEGDYVAILTLPGVQVHEVEDNADFEHHKIIAESEELAVSKARMLWGTRVWEVCVIDNSDEGARVLWHHDDHPGFHRFTVDIVQAGPNRHDAWKQLAAFLKSQQLNFSLHQE